MKITPTWVGTFELGLRTLIGGAAQRIVKNLFWDKFVDIQKSETLEERYFFPIEAAQLRKEGSGGNKRYDDQAAASLVVVNENFGDGLRLTKNEIEDNVMKSPQGMPALRFSESWARQMGALAARWPQDNMFDLLAAGETAIGYDGVPYFGAAHPINPTRGSAVFANLLTGAANGAYPGACPIDSSVTLDVAANNFAKAVAYVQSLRGPNGKPRHLRVTAAMTGLFLQKRILEILDTKYLTLNGIENVVARYQIEPVIAAEMPADATYFYLFCEMIPGEGGGIIYQDREGAVLSSYAAESYPQLQQRKEFLWSFDGRDGMGYGHPWLIFKVKAA